MSIFGNLKTAVSKHKNKDFLKAVVSGCVVIAAADGNISTEEKAKTLGFIKRNESLSIFSPSEVVREFNNIADELAFDYEIGKLTVRKTLEKLSGNIEAAEVLVRVCCAIGRSDGDFDYAEKEACRWICGVVNVNPADVGL